MSFYFYILSFYFNNYVIFFVIFIVFVLYSYLDFNYIYFSDTLVLIVFNLT